MNLRITAWSGRLYDREASNHVAVHHDDAASAGRYNKRLLPKAAFAALTATMSEARTKHYSQSLPWDDKGARLLTVAPADIPKSARHNTSSRQPGSRCRAGQGRHSCRPPRIFAHINPYGRFEVNLDRRIDFERRAA